MRTNRWTLKCSIPACELDHCQCGRHVDHRGQCADWKHCEVARWEQMTEAERELADQVSSAELAAGWDPSP